MSLHVIANHMASKGRGSDSMLVHMAPEEVRGLEALANAYGGELTINPDTGLPEANFLKKLLPTIIGAGLTYFSGGAINPAMAGAIVGGVETARTGDIGRGLSAGLGAYGGAGMTANLAGAGTNAMTTAGVGNYAETLAAQGLEAGTPAFGEAASQLALNAQKEALAAPFADKLSAGFDVATKDPATAGAFLKDNAKNLMYAAGPAIMAGANVQSKLPQTVTKPGMIRPFSFDPYSGTYTALTPYEATPTRAAGGGLMGMADGGYNPGDLDFAERSEPVVRMAAGGMSQDYVNQLVKEAATQAGGTLSYADAANAARNLGISEDMLRSAASNTGFITGAPTPVAGPAAGSAAYNSMVGDFFSNPNITAADVSSAMSTYGLNQADVANAMRASGLSNAAVYSAFQPDVGVPSTPLGGLAGLSSNINAALSNFRGVEGRAPTRAEAEAAMGMEGYNELDFIRATGMTLDEYFKEKKKPPIIPITPITPLTLDTNLGGVAGGSGGGNSVLNPDGTITTFPNIPGRPEGGFTGMGQVRDVYTQGGGSLGYTPYAPTSIADFEAKYNRLGGGSKQAYDFLTGKTDEYPLTPYTRTGEIQRPYFESVGRMPTDITTKKYLFQDGKYVENPDYVPPVYKDGVKSAGLTTREVIKGIEPFKDAKDDVAMFDWMTENNVTEQQLATALGIPLLEARARIAAARKNKKNADEVAAAAAAAAAVPEGGANGGLMGMARGGMASQYNLGDYSDGGRLLRGPGDGVSDSIPASIGNKRPARLADGEFVVPARIVSELGNGSTEAGARKLYAMMDRVQKARRKTTGKKRVAVNTRSDKYLPA